MDAIDLRILARLQEDARISNVDLAQRGEPVAVAVPGRVRALEEAGTIGRYVTLLDPMSSG